MSNLIEVSIPGRAFYYTGGSSLTQDPENSGYHPYLCAKVIAAVGKPVGKGVTYPLSLTLAEAEELAEFFGDMASAARDG